MNLKLGSQIKCNSPEGEPGELARKYCLFLILQDLTEKDNPL